MKLPFTPSSWWNGTSGRSNRRRAAATTRISRATAAYSRSGTSGQPIRRRPATASGSATAAVCFCAGVGGAAEVGVRRAASPRRRARASLRRGDLVEAVVTCRCNLREPSEESLVDVARPLVVLDRSDQHVVDAVLGEEAVRLRLAGVDPLDVLLARSVVQAAAPDRSEEHTSELQSRLHLVCRLLLEKKKNNRL